MKIIEGTCKDPKEDNLYCIFVPVKPGYSVGHVIRGEDANWQSREIIAHAELPTQMNQAEANRFRRTGNFPLHFNEHPQGLEVERTRNKIHTVKPLEKLRQTGRTTRMLDKAEKAALSGKAVYVIAETMANAKWLKEKFGPEKALKLGVKFESDRSCNFNWEQMKVLNAHPNCLFLVDHHAIEARFDKALEMLHRFDS